MHFKPKKLPTLLLLTGNPVVRAFFDRMMEKLEDHALSEKTSLVLILMEIDQYPQILKARGENVAHALIVDFEDHLQKIMRTQDLLYNQNQGKFAIFLPKTSCKAALFIAQNIQEYLDGEIFSEGPLCFTVTVSIGIATLGQAGHPVKNPATNLERLLKAALTCLNQAKEKKNMIITEENR